MHHQEFEPSLEVQDAIKCFWYNSREFGGLQSSFEVVPDGYAEIIFHFGDGCSISRNGSLQPLPSPFLMGLLNQPVHFYTEGHLEIIGVRCFPWAVFDLLGLPSGKGDVHIFEHPISQLQSILDPLILAGRLDEALTQIKQYFLNGCSKIAVNSMLFKAGAAMSDSKGTMRISQIAKAADATVRTLERKFKQSSGFSMKDVSALMRFEQVRNQLWKNPDVNIAGLAYEFGYTDQPHLSKEFKKFTGTTPAAFARKAKKDKQALSSDFVAFIQA